jgi:hypothetical protein
LILSYLGSYGSAVKKSFASMPSFCFCALPQIWTCY